MLEFKRVFTVIEIGDRMLGQVQTSNMCDCYCLTGSQID